MNRDHLNFHAATYHSSTAPSAPVTPSTLLHRRRRHVSSAIGHVRDGKALSRALTTTVTMSTSVGVNVRIHAQCSFRQLARSCWSWRKL
jgi:hypothetical protein